MNCNHCTATLVVLWIAVAGLFVNICHGGQEINVALTDNGGTCSSSFILGPYTACTLFTDGIVSTNPAQKWAYTGNLLRTWVQFNFSKLYRLNTMVFTHAFYADERNIKQILLEFENEDSLTAILANRNEAAIENDTISLGARISSFVNMTVISVYDVDQKYSSMKEIEILGEEVPTTITELTTTTPTTTSTPSTTTPSTTTHNSPSTTSATETTSSPLTTTLLTPPPAQPSTNPTTDESEEETATVSSSTSFTTSSTVSTERMSKKATKPSEPPNQDELYIIIGVVIAALIVLILIIVIVVILIRKRRESTKDINSNGTAENGYINMAMVENRTQVELEEPVPEMTPEISRKSAATPPPPVKEPSDLKVVDADPTYSNVVKRTYSRPIKVVELADQVDEMLQRPDTFKAEFGGLPSGKQHPMVFAERNTLYPKNRFRNIKPYDHSRVVLSRVKSSDSVYINANYISSYAEPKYYIAAQGPNDKSVNDFWRMIWEQNSSTIVMATNCVEAGKDKCEKYWPTTKDEPVTFDTLNITLIENTVLSDYTIRDFKMSRNEETREVRQYHYTSWPDEGVPTSCSALIAFVNRIREETEDKKPPIIVHCSAGVGRTGTFVGVNYSIEQAKEEGVIDIQKVVYKMREDRINMVQTLSQYKFLYATMLEYLYCGEVAIACQGAKERIEQVFKTPEGEDDSLADKQWKVLEVFKPKNYASECNTAREEENIAKNRSQDVLPSDNYRLYLGRRPDFPSDYLNAVFASGYKKQYNFVITQHPLENTMIDLWRAVVDMNISTIVMLNNLTDDAKPYWPNEDDNETAKYGDLIEVTRQKKDEQDGIVTTDLEGTVEHEDKTHLVTHIQATSWPEDQSLPDLSLLPNLHNAVVQAQAKREDSRIMVHCLNGDHRSGLYCIMHYMFDKIKTEQEIDAFNAVKSTRMSRPTFIPDMECYRFLHDASVNFIEQFELYANFK